MKKKSGFTLIELLVAIAIMLSILGIAIVSFVNVSDKKKEESWETVKRQIELAAEEFFTYNEYLFEGLSDGAEAQISVGKLVQEDYLNKVTNPITGKAVSECMIVKVTKTNGTYKLEVDDTSKNSDAEICETGSSLTIKEVGAPEIILDKECGSKGKNGWCKRSSDGKGVTITANAPEAVRVEHEVSTNNTGVWDPSGDIKNGKTYEDNENTNFSGKSVCFLATGSNGAKSSACVDYKIDMDLPNGEVKIISAKGNSYNSKEVNITGSVYDNESGVASVLSNPKVSFDSATGNVSLNNHKLFNSFNAESKSIVLKVIDNAGNENNVESNKYIVYKECDDTKYLETKEEIKTDCTGKCGGKKTATVYNIYVDSVTDKVCKKDFVKNNEKDCDACPNLTCPTPKILATVGDNGWYKKGDVTYTEGKNKYYFALEITPTEGTDYWNWYTGYKGGSYTYWGKNKGKQIKTLSDGNRIAKVVIYDGYGNSKECPYEYNIDTKPPTIKCSSITINHSCQNDEQDSYGLGKNVTITSKNVYSGHKYMVHRCEGDTPLVNKKCTVTDDLSGPSDKSDHSFQYVSTIKKKGRNTCRITDGENPCDTEFVLNGYDKAGNSASEIFKFVTDYYSGLERQAALNVGYTTSQFISK